MDKREELVELSGQIINGIISLELTTKWRNNCNGLDSDNNINKMLIEYHNRFNWK